MRYAVIADIHGNIRALEAVMNDATRQNIDEYIFAGDYYRDFPYINETVSLIRSLKNAHVIAGNNEEYLARMRSEDQATWTRDQYSALYWNFRECSAENMVYLCALPNELTIEGKIRVIHSMSAIFPREKELLLYAGTIPRNFDILQEHARRQLSKNSDVTQTLNDCGESVFIFGHSHVQWFAEMNGKLLINPGSCGAPLDAEGGAPYTILEIGGGKLCATQRRVEYDMDGAMDEARAAAAYTASPIWYELLFHQMRTRTESFVVFFRIGMEEFGHGSPYSNEEWARMFALWQKRVGHHTSAL